MRGLAHVCVAGLLGPCGFWEGLTEWAGREERLVGSVGGFLWPEEAVRAWPACDLQVIPCARRPVVVVVGGALARDTEV